MILSIVIPTYNRPNAVLERVRELIPQLNNLIELIIVDNSSQINVQEFVTKEIPESADVVRFVRNVANIGACGNINRCFELGAGEWTWILGDDDLVEADSLSKIVATIHSGTMTEKVAGVYFSTTVHRYEKSAAFTNVADFCKYILQTNPFRNALFMSSNVFRTRVARENLRHAYHYSTTFFPHVVLAIACVHSGGNWLVSDQLIVRREMPDEANQWSQYTLSAGIPLLLDLPFASGSIQDHIRHPLERFLWVPLIKGGIRMILFNDNYSSAYWKFSLIRFVFLTTGIKKIKLILLFIFAVFCEKLPFFKSLCRYVFRNTISTKVTDPSISGQARN